MYFSTICPKISLIFWGIDEEKLMSVRSYLFLINLLGGRSLLFSYSLTLNLAEKTMYTMYHRQKNKWYPHRWQIVIKTAKKTAALCIEIWNLTLPTIMGNGSKFDTAKIESSFEMGKYTPLGVPFILLAMLPNEELL